MRIFCVVNAVIIFMMTTLAYAEQGKAEGLPIKIGDTVEEVQKALNTKLEPEKTTSISMFDKNKKKSQLQLKTKGMFISFEKGKVVLISLQKPFSGNISGIKLGDSLSKIEKAFGPAVKNFSFGDKEAYLYYFDDITTTRFDINSDDELETIYLFK